MSIKNGKTFALGLFVVTFFFFPTFGIWREILSLRSDFKVDLKNYVVCSTYLWQQDCPMMLEPERLW